MEYFFNYVIIVVEEHKTPMIFYRTDDLYDEEIVLKLAITCEEIPTKQYVPAYFFDICLLNGTIVGACDLRIGHNKKTYIGGNIGYRISEDYRGHHYAARACHLLFKLAKKHGLEYVIISCGVDNIPSYKTCLSVGCEFIEIKDVPETSDLYPKLKQVRIYKKIL